MQKKHNSELVQNARALRKEMTLEERILWYHYLRRHPAKFYRQRVFGNYIVDFYCAKAKLAVELDGSQHYEDRGLEYDAHRTAYLESLGLCVLRVPNTEVKKNLAGVCEGIDALLRQRGYTPPPAAPVPLP